MSFFKAVLWFNFILALGAFSVSVSSAEIIVSVVTAIANFFSIDCIYFLAKSSKTGVLDENLAKILSSDFSFSFGFSNFSAYDRVLKKGHKEQCQIPLRVILQMNNIEALEVFNEFYENYANIVRSGAWLVFTSSFDEKSVSEMLRGVHVPLDTEVIIAWIHNDMVHLKEVYQVAPSYPLRQPYFGNWSLNEGLNISKPFRQLEKTNLEGLELRVAYIEENLPFTISRSSANGPVLEGYFGEIWNALEKILNMSSTFIKVDLIRGKEDGNPWLNIMNMIKDKKIDAGLADFFPSKPRTQSFDFSHPLLTSDFQVFYQYIPSNRQSKVYLHLFGNDIWLTLFIWAVINSLSISCATILRRHFMRAEGKVITAQTSFFMTLTGLFAQGSPSIPKFWSCRILFLFTYIVAAIVVPSYSSSLTRRLIAESPGIIYYNLVNIYEKGFHKIITVDGSYEYFTFKSNTGRNVLRKIYNQHMRKTKLPQSYSEALLHICNDKKIAFFTVTSSLMWELNKRANIDLLEKCRLQKMNQNVGKSVNAIIFPKNSRFRKLIDQGLKVFYSTGLIHRLQHKYWPKHIALKKKNWESVTVWNSLILFEIILCGGIVSVFLLVLEKTVKSAARRRSTK